MLYTKLYYYEITILILLQDFESERKWKLALAKKVAIRASKGMLDQATRGERRVKVGHLFLYEN